MSRFCFAGETKTAADDILIFFFYLLKKIRLDVLCEPSALQRIHMKYQALFSLKNNEEIFVNVICCSCDSGALRVNSTTYTRHHIATFNKTLQVYKHGIPYQSYQTTQVLAFNTGRQGHYLGSEPQPTYY